MRTNIVLMLLCCVACAASEVPSSVAVVGVVTRADPSEVHAHRVGGGAHSIEYYDVITLKVEAPSELAGTSICVHLPVPKYSASTHLVGKRIGISLPKASLEPIDFRLSEAKATIQEMPNLK